jgi:mannose-6-phosphate isomerase-like protein (cupin superfamily)
VIWERLMFWGDEDVEFLEATYEPGGASSPDDSLVRHNGHEFGYVLSGTLRVVVGFDEFILEPGDSITFPSSTPHRLSNDGSETVHAVWVVRGRRGAEPVRETPETTSKAPAARRAKPTRPVQKHAAPLAGKRKR